MTAEDKDIRSFRDIRALQKRRKLCFMVYHSTKAMPQEERFSTVSQMRRAAMSIASNLSEGFGRESTADKAHFYIMARGSITELQNQVILTNDVGLLSP